MRAAREAAGLTLQDATFAVRQLLPQPLWISQSTIQRMEAGRITEDKADPFDVAVLASIYDRKVIDLSDAAAAKIQVLNEVVARSRCSSDDSTSSKHLISAAA